MKLLDLQTGKYLELEKDWLYGGESIFLPNDIQYIRSEYTFRIEQATSKLPEPLKTLSAKVGAVIYGRRYALLYKVHTFRSNYYLPPYASLNEKEEIVIGDCTHTDIYHLIVCYGPMVYNGVLNKPIPMLYAKDQCGSTTYYANGTPYVEFVVSGKHQYNTFDGNIFEEYSKQLRNEPNKFDELYNLMYEGN